MQSSTRSTTSLERQRQENRVTVQAGGWAVCVWEHRIPGGTLTRAEVANYPNWQLASCLQLESFQREPGLISY